MQERDFDEITRFLTTVSKVTLFDYLGVPEDAPAPTIDQAIRKRRSWAQGQQANPKYRVEALWVIKNQRLLRSALIEHKDLYLSTVRNRDEARNLEILTLFIRGTLASGTLTRAGEEAILEQGRKLGLGEAAVRGAVEELVEEHGARREGGDDLVDHYESLGIEPTSTIEEIDQAYRARYRWARNLADKRKARDAYARLDAALRDLKDPERRAEYDRLYTQTRGRPAGPPALDQAQAFLPPPQEPPPRPEPTHPSQASATGPRLAPARVDEDTAPPGTAPPVRRPSATDDPHTHSSSRRAPVPRPPQRVRGKTLKLQSAGTQDARGDGTRMQLRSPSSVQVKVGRRPETVAIHLEQVGSGTVTARILADRNWVTVEPSRLGPEASSHTVQATIHPSRMPKARGSSVVTIVPSHGPRLAVTIDAEQRRGPPVLVLGLVALLLVLVALAGAAYTFIPSPQPPAAPARVLEVRPDPPTAIVQVGEDHIGVGGGVYDEDLPPGRVPVMVSLDGFTTFRDQVEVVPGQPVVLQPRLELSEPLTYVPPSTEDGVELAADGILRVVGQHTELVEPCFADSGFDHLQVRGYLNAAGKLRGLQVAESEDQGELPPELVTCVTRGLRAMTFEVSDPADYWAFDVTIEAGG